jgi:hypothetical protein
MVVSHGHWSYVLCVLCQAEGEEHMNHIDNIMALAHRWSLATYNKALGKEFEDFDEIQKALQAAIEQVLKPGEPVAVPEGWHIAKADNGQVLVSAPNCDPGSAWIKNQGPLPQRILYALVGAMLDAPQPQPKQEPLTDEQIQDLLKKGNPTDEEMRLVRLGYSAQPYDQTALELCESCGWKTLIPGEGCLNCERKPQHKGEIAQARAAIAKTTGGES